MLDTQDHITEQSISLSPRGWHIVKLGDADVSTLIMGQSPPSATYNMRRDGLPFLQGKAEFGAKYPAHTKWCSAPLKVAERGDVLMSVRAPVGNVNLALEKCCIGRGLAAVRAGVRVDGEFLFYRLMYDKPRIEQQGSGTTFKSINRDVLREFELLLPPSGEQSAIANILSKLQAVVAAQAAIADLTRELKRALMAKLFTEGLHGEALKEAQIGLVPESWEVAKLGDCLTQAQYGLSVRGEKTGKYPILRMTNQQAGAIVGTNLQYVNISDAELLRFKLHRGDLLFNRTNSIDLVGRTALYDLEGDFVFASYLIRLALDNDKIDPIFLNHYLNHETTQARLKGLATRGVSQSNISASRLKSFVVPVPSLDEQREMTHVLHAVDAKIASAERKRVALEELFRAILMQLMTGQVRVPSLT